MMTSDLQSQIKGLSSTEKVELLDVLWESMEAEPPSVTDGQQAELDYRVAKYEGNPSDVILWDNVRAGLFKSH